MIRNHYIKPSDARSWLSCAKRAWFDNFPPKGPVSKVSEFDQLIIDQGLAHEKVVLDQLSENHTIHRAQSVDHTRQLMEEGAEIIYQAYLESREERLIGNPDFLIRQETGEYLPADAKLSRSYEKSEIQIQLGFYRRMLGCTLPGIVFLGTGEQKEIGDEANPSVDQFITGMRNVLDNDDPPLVRYSHSKCKTCPYYLICKPDFEERGEITLVYGVDSRNAPHLENEGIATMQRLADTDAEIIPNVPYLKGYEKKKKAVLQAQSWLAGKVFKLKDFELPSGTWIHFDVEDNPLEVSGQKHVYLWGFLKPDYGTDAFEYSWTDTMVDDRSGWEQFLSMIEKYRNEYQNLVIAHYSAHEVTTIKQYAKRYEMFNHSTVEWLLGETTALYDLQKPILDNLVLPLQGYGLKDVCKHKDLVNFQWEDEESGSQWSVVQFFRFLEEREPVKRNKLKNAILGYNRDDVLATRKLEEWLREMGNLPVNC
jgi:predicted RecB family nuclease